MSAERKKQNTSTLLHVPHPILLLLCIDLCFNVLPAQQVGGRGKVVPQRSLIPLRTVWKSPSNLLTARMGCLATIPTQAPLVQVESVQLSDTIETSCFLCTLPAFTSLVVSPWSLSFWTTLEQSPFKNELCESHPNSHEKTKLYILYVDNVNKRSNCEFSLTIVSTLVRF